MTTDQQGDRLSPVLPQRRQETGMPDGIENRRACPVKALDLLDAFEVILPGGRQCFHRPSGGDHATILAASSATRLAAPGVPKREVISGNASRCVRASLPLRSSSGRAACARPEAVAAPWSNSGATRRPATRFTRPTWLVRTSRRARLKVIGCIRYAITIGTFASAASSVAVPDLVITASAVANTSAGAS